EPEAAAVHFASTTRVRVGEGVAVYDLGGGTFDAAVLRKTDNGFELLGKPEGIEHLGGVDFDDAVVAHVRAALGDAVDVGAADEGARATSARFRLDCVQAKENLSYDHETTIVVILPGVHTEVRLTRAEFEEMIGPAVDATVRAVDRALRAAGVDAEQVATVLLAGGSSRIPLVAERIVERLQLPVAVSGHPKHSVALGAAYLAGTASSLPEHPAIPVADAVPAAAAPAAAGTAGDGSADSPPEADAPRRGNPGPGGRRRPSTAGRRGWVAAGAVGAAVAVSIVGVMLARNSGGNSGGVGSTTAPGAPASLVASTTEQTPTSGAGTRPTVAGTGGGAAKDDSRSAGRISAVSSAPKSTTTSGDVVAGSSPDPASWCATLKDSFGDIHGKTVQLLATNSGANGYRTGFGPWEECTGAKIELVGAASPSAVNDKAASRLDAGDPPDLVATAHPGAIKDWDEHGGEVQPVPALARANLAAFYAESWSDLGSVDGTVYAVPGDTSVKSLIWYSPKRFAARGYQVPTTVDQLEALTEQIVQDGGTPWCLGIADGPATGWPLSDWLEDIVLRQAGPDVYDQWVAHA